MEDQLIHGEFEAQKRRELERDTLKLEPRYHFDDEEQEYWRSVFGEVKPPEIEPESNAPFFDDEPKKCEEPETQKQMKEIERFGYFLKFSA